MAEFCLDCYNRLHGTDDPAEKYVMSGDLELCEGCGEWRRVLVKEKEPWNPLGMLSWSAARLKCLFLSLFRRGRG